MKKISGFLICLLVTTLAHAESPNLAGSWKVTFSVEPGRTTAGTQCVVFTLVPGTVGDVATSGTWTSPTFPNWRGEWIQLGDYVRWFGVTGTGFATIESGNLINPRQFAGTSFNHFSISTGASASAGTWIGSRVNSCSGIEKSNGDDPAQNILGDAEKITM